MSKTQIRTDVNSTQSTGRIVRSGSLSVLNFGTARNPPGIEVTRSLHGIRGWCRTNLWSFVCVPLPMRMPIRKVLPFMGDRTERRTAVIPIRFRNWLRSGYESAQAKKIRSVAAEVRSADSVTSAVEALLRVPPKPTPIRTYERWACDWPPQECPICKTKTAVARGHLFDREPPRPPRTDDRTPVGEVFLHADKTECRVSP
jgi:hypothetical protein